MLTSSATVTATFGPPGGFDRFSRIDEYVVPTPLNQLIVGDINDSSEFVGWYTPTFIRDDQGFLGELEGVYPNIAGLAVGPKRIHAINRHGWFVGESADPGGRTRAVLWYPAPSFEVEDLGTLGGLSAVAYGINQSNHIVGQAETASTSMHAFLREPSGLMRDMGTLGGSESVASAISITVYIVGHAQRSDGMFRAFRTTIFEPEVLTELGTLGGDESLAYDVAAFGAVVGEADVGDGERHAFFIDDAPSTELIDIGTLGGDNSVARRINASKVVVGMAEDATGSFRPFIWNARDRVIVDLNDLLPDGGVGWELLDVGSINDRGEVAGFGLIDGAERVFVLRP